LFTPVDVRGADQVGFVDRQPVRPPVHLSGAGVDDPDARVEPPARFEDGQLRTAVDLEVRVRVPHAVDVADLPRQVEDDLAVLDQAVHRRHVAHVGDVDADVVLDSVDVVPVGTILRVHGVDQQDVRAGGHELPCQVAADEARGPR
jgi:hypothetical protein